MMNRLAFFVVIGWLGSLELATPANAHISVTSHTTRYDVSQLKMPPCGGTGVARGSTVYTYAPGQTITIALTEFIPHPGYFRIAFQRDGDDKFIDPRTINPVDPARACPFVLRGGPIDQCCRDKSCEDFNN